MGTRQCRQTHLGLDVYVCHGQAAPTLITALSLFDTLLHFPANPQYTPMPLPICIPQLTPIHTHAIPFLSATWASTWSRRLRRCAPYRTNMCKRCVGSAAGRGKGGQLGCKCWLAGAQASLGAALRRAPPPAARQPLPHSTPPTTTMHTPPPPTHPSAPPITHADALPRRRRAGRRLL